MPPAPRPYLVTQNPACPISHGQNVDSSVIRVLQRFCMSYRRVLSCSPIVWIARSARPLLVELYRGESSTTTLSGIFAFTFCSTALIEDSLSQRSLNLASNKCFTKPATELARPSVAPFFFLPILHACSPCLNQQLLGVHPDRHRLRHPRLGPFSLRNSLQ